MFESLLQVPGNRIGYGAGISLAQLKLTQEVITLAVFVPFALVFMDQPPKLDFLWAGLCLVGAVHLLGVDDFRLYASVDCEACFDMPLERLAGFRGWREFFNSHVEVPFAWGAWRALKLPSCPFDDTTVTV